MIGRPWHTVPQLRAPTRTPLGKFQDWLTPNCKGLLDYSLVLSRAWGNLTYRHYGNDKGRYLKPYMRDPSRF